MCIRDRHVTKEMQWGLDHEDDAATAYELHTGELVDRVMAEDDANDPTRCGTVS